MHGHPILPGNAKYLITDILNTWQDMDHEKITKDSYIQWPQKDAQCRSTLSEHASRLENLMDGEAVMTGNAETYQELGLKRGRKRKIDFNNWKVTQKRIKSNSGTGKVMKPGCKPCNPQCDPPCVLCNGKGCRQKCYQKLSDEQREKAFNHYWSLGNPQRQWDFVSSCLKVVEKQRSRKRKATSDVDRTTIKRYIGETEVCKTMFEDTLCISKQVVKTVLSKRDENGAVKPDLRGRTGNKPTLRPDVIEHIKMFPVRDTHYCRSGTNRRFLHEDLSIPKMHELYGIWCEEEGKEKCDVKFYRKVFLEEFNLSFHMRKKDKCKMCDHFDNSNISKERKRKCFREIDTWEQMTRQELMDIEIDIDDDNIDDDVDDTIVDGVDGDNDADINIAGVEVVDASVANIAIAKTSEDSTDDSSEDKLLNRYRHHRKEVELSRKIKKQCKTNAAHSRGEQVTAHFDLQQVMDCPQTNVGDTFYKRLLSVYNFVVVDVTADDGDEMEAHCYVWAETDGNRGTNEICSNLQEFCKVMAARGVKTIHFICDGCGGQQRNTLLAAMMHHIVNTLDIQTITVYFLIKGHTENEADTVHSTIERDKKKKKVFVPSDWPVIIRNTPTDKFKMHTHSMTYSDFLDVKKLQKDAYKNFRLNAEGETILNWFQIRVMRVEKGSKYLQFKNRFADKKFSSINLMQIGKGRRREEQIYAVPTTVKAYQETLPISEAKYSDLQDLCSGVTPVIPPTFHHYYRGLKH